MKQIRPLSGLCIGLLIAGCDVANSGPPDLQTMHEVRPIGETKEFKVDLKYAVGQLEITKGSDENLFSFDLQYDRRHYNPAFHFDDGEHASMQLDMNGHTGLGSGGGRDNDLTVKLSDKVPLDLDITSGVSESQLEMTSLQVRRMHLRGGVGKTEVSFDKPAS
jgi:hypothetical protein